MKIEIIDKSQKKQWDDYVLSNPNGIAYQLFAWNEAVKKAYGFRSHYLMAVDREKVIGILPLTIFKRPFGSKSYVSLPYCDAGGPLADTPEIEKKLLEHAFKLAKENYIKKLVIRSTKPFADINQNLTINDQKVRMLLDLPSSSEELMKSFKSKLRSQVKKPIKDGLKISTGSTELMAEFYPLFAENMRDLGSPVHSRRWLEAVLDEFQERAVLFLVRMPDKTPAAGGIILCHSKTVSVPWASSLRRLNRSNPNMMLYWGFLEYASENGFKQFDFGRSTPNEGTYRFKKQWGAQPIPLHWSDFSENLSAKSDIVPDEMDSVHKNSKIRNSVEKIIRTLPIPVATALGSYGRKYITL